MTNLHVLPYQGSKRKLAPQILELIDFPIDRLYEPFAGSAAVTIAAANQGLAQEYIIGDKLRPLAELWKMIIEQPKLLSEQYEALWNAQLDDPYNYYFDVRKKFNKNPAAAEFLYLAARCVKNAIRFNGSGEFNQGVDKRRLGTKPQKMSKSIHDVSALLQDKTLVRSGDFQEIIEDATPDDLIYMDPPWQGTSNKTNPRYAFLLDLDELIYSFEGLNERQVPYIISFDGVCGDKKYGKDLPDYLKLKKLLLNAGRSTQATLLGKKDVTMESLYLSPAFIAKSSDYSALEDTV